MSKSETKGSLLEQIIEAMIAALESKNEFDADTIQKLKVLAGQGDLVKVKAVIEAIKSQ